ncbi:hypothetical protein EVAR_17497_1 [Eumeta japonica]|uniref:Uncharacterized protein n=1 Tax=Eumeta variegata TaxID=151549 RepID=A0A4C1WS87_EUMVA|nr:hypothetical protein EVAR_17497_1 [Eumeta japonica]
MDKGNGLANIIRRTYYAKRIMKGSECVGACEQKGGYLPLRKLSIPDVVTTSLEVPSRTAPAHSARDPILNRPECRALKSQNKHYAAKRLELNEFGSRAVAFFHDPVPKILVSESRAYIKGLKTSGANTRRRRRLRGVKRHTPEFVDISWPSTRVYRWRPTSAILFDLPVVTLATERWRIKRNTTQYASPSADSGGVQFPDSIVSRALAAAAARRLRFCLLTCAVPTPISDFCPPVSHQNTGYVAPFAAALRAGAGVSSALTRDADLIVFADSQLARCSSPSR